VLVVLVVAVVWTVVVEGRVLVVVVGRTRHGASDFSSRQSTSLSGSVQHLMYAGSVLSPFLVQRALIARHATLRDTSLQMKVAQASPSQLSSHLE